jgi:hypothetical protein
MPDSLERRAVLLLLVSGLVIPFATNGLFVLSLGIETWRVALYIASLAGLVVALILALLTLAPDNPRTAVLPDRSALVFWGFAAFSAGISLTALSAAIAAIQALGNQTPFE